MVIFKKTIPELPTLDIIPSSIRLTATEIDLVNGAVRERLLSKFYSDNKNILNDYDYILMDTNLNLGMINQNIFLLVEHIILVSDISTNGIMGAEFFIAYWETIRNQL